MSRRKAPPNVTRRDLIKATTLGVGALATPRLDEANGGPHGRRRSRQVTLTLDSGAFLIYEEEGDEGYSEVGYFNPDIIIFGDGEEIAHITPGAIGTGGAQIEVRQTDARGRTLESGVTLANSFKESLLHLNTLYDERYMLADRQRYHCIFFFTSGHFCGSMIKPRAFKEAHGQPHQLTGRRKTLSNIAHDIDVYYELAGREALTLTMNEQKLWSSADHPNVGRRFDIQVLADNSTAEMFYRDALVLNAGEAYWLPNQGDPPPTWSHVPGGSS